MVCRRFMDWVFEPVGRGEHTLGKFPSYLANSPRDFHHMMGIRLFNGNVLAGKTAWERVQ